jgi:hypothetical protein
MRPSIRIYYSNVSYCSTCFEQHIAHHQELKNCNCSLWFYMSAVAGCCQRPATTDVVSELLIMSDVSLETCCAIRNVEIINSNTRAHLVGYF